MKEKDVLPENYWHCQVELSEDGQKKNRYTVCNDLTLDDLYQQIVTPWHSDRAFAVNGVIIKSTDAVQRIKITNTPQPKSYYAAEHNEKMSRLNYSDRSTDRRLLPLSLGKDYTHDLIFKEQKVTHTKKTLMSANSKNVFIVHGHDGEVKETTARFIEKLGLKAVILDEQANEGQTIFEKLEKHTDAAYAIALFTPDDVGASSASQKNLKPRARQNVLVEFGYMAARIGRERVCVLKKGDIEMPSDLSGLVYIDIDARGAWHLALAKELKNAGLDVDLNKAM